LCLGARWLAVQRARLFILSRVIGWWLLGGCVVRWVECGIVPVRMTVIGLVVWLGVVWVSVVVVLLLLGRCLGRWWWWVWIG
jgi:hypothetical protein